MTVVVRQHQCCWRHHAWSTDVNTAAIARTVTACLVPRDYSGSAVYVEGAGLASREVVSYAELCGRLLSVSCASSIEVGTLIFFFFLFLHDILFLKWRHSCRSRDWDIYITVSESDYW